jgi:P-type Cu+ transporter
MENARKRSSGLAEIDPVCGMEVEADTAAGSFEFRGTTYYFCSRGCLEDFREDPEAYLTPAS